MQNDILKKIKFVEILSGKSVHGLIWTGVYNDKPCIIKMLLLKSGRTPEKDKKYFKHNDKAPFYHEEFPKLRVKSKSSFLNEAKSYAKLSSLGLAPKIFAYWITKTNDDIHYGFIVNQKVDGSAKDILLKRKFTSNENKLLNKFIADLHNKYEITHGDLKPSNIGVILDKEKFIKKCYVFDCGGVRYKKNLSTDEFKIRVKKDLNNYEEHIIKNREIDSKLHN